MKISARDIDHVSLTLTDPEAAIARLQQLGFTLTPEGVEPRCICFQPQDDEMPSYLELLQGEPPGMALALNVAELEGEERTHIWETEDGLEIDAGVIVGQGEAQPLPWFPVSHETPDAFMEPEWIVHPNGALALMAVHVIADSPKDVAAALKESWSAEVEEIIDGCVLVKTGSVELLVWSAAALQAEYKAIEIMAPEELPAIVGVTIAVERPRPLQALLRANNVPFALAEGDRVLTSPEQSGGLMFEFLPQT